MEQKTLLIIGGGIIGSTIALEALKCSKFSKIKIIEKERALGIHSSTRNSGVIHSGFYYSPDSKKALFCSSGNKLMRDYCEKNNIPVKKCGKVVVSSNEAQEETLLELFKRGKANHCDVELYPCEKLHSYEPLAKTYKKFLWSPNTWSTSPIELMNCIRSELIENNVDINYNTKIVSKEKDSLVDSNGNYHTADIIINAAGGYSLSIAEVLGLKTDFVILPFKGLYLKSTHKVTNFKTHIYPVPDINQPFLGIHTTLTCDGFLKLGPTALPAFSPENYSFLEGINFKDFTNILPLQLELLYKNYFGYREIAVKQINYIFKKNIINEAQRLTNLYLKINDFKWHSPGIRAQVFNKKSKLLEMDFIRIKENNVYHIINAISPAWTCSFQTARSIVEEIANQN